MKSKQFNLSLVVFLSAASAFVYLFATTWFKWGGLIVDTFWEFWVSEQILRGKILYKDLFYEYGFLPPYFLALLFRIFSVHINVMVCCGVVITALVSTLIYKISRLFLDEMVSGLAVITFLFVFAFGDHSVCGIFNFILPYSISMTLFTLFVACALYFFLKFIFSEKQKYLVLWGICLSFAFFCRVVISFLVWGSFLLTAIVFILRNSKQRHWQLSLLLFSPFLVSFVGYLSFLGITHGFCGFKESIVNHIFVLISNPYTKTTIGFHNIFQNISLAFKSFFLQTIAVVLLGISSAGISSFFLNKRKSYPFLVLQAIVIFLVFVITRKYILEFSQYRCVSLILISGVIMLFVRNILASYSRKNTALLTLFFVSLMLTSRVFLKTALIGYAFCLLVLGMICYYLFFFEIVGRFLQKYVAGYSRPLFFSILICFFLFLNNVRWTIVSNLYAKKDLMVVTDRGRFASRNTPETFRFWETVAYLMENTSEDDTVVAIPEGVGINFFSRRENPLGYCNFIPPIFESIDEKKLIRDFTESDIDYVVIVHRTTSEYGARSFGIDYGKELNAWILDNYRQVKLIGPYPFTSNEFGVAIFKKQMKPKIMNRNISTPRGLLSEQRPSSHLPQ